MTKYVFLVFLIVSYIYGCNFEWSILNVNYANPAHLMLLFLLSVRFEIIKIYNSSWPSSSAWYSTTAMRGPLNQRKRDAISLPYAYIPANTLGCCINFPTSLKHSRRGPSSKISKLSVTRSRKVASIMDLRSLNSLTLFLGLSLAEEKTFNK